LKDVTSILRLDSYFLCFKNRINYLIINYQNVYKLACLQIKYLNLTSIHDFSLIINP